jgi:carboxylesterase type B
MVRSWGESAGSESVSIHMVINDGNPDGLFRAGIMQSAALPSVGDITEAQPFFDSIVSTTGCSDVQTNGGDILECLRGVDEVTFQKAADMIPGIVTEKVSRISFHFTAWFR